MKMRNLLMNMACIALLLIAAGCVIQQPPPPPPQQGPQEKYVPLDGPIFSVQKSPGVYETVRIGQIFIQTDSAMDPVRAEALRANIIQSRVDIREACRQIVTSVGYQYLFNDEKRATMEGRLRQEIIRILKGKFTDKEVKGVVLGGYSVSA